MASDVTTTTEIALDILEIARQATELTTDGPPDLVYHAAAEPAIDCCPVLTVHSTEISEESTSPLSPTPATGRRAAYGRINLVAYTITVMRCTAELSKQGTTTVEDEEAVAAQVEQDGWAIWAALYWALQNETLVGGCQIAHIGGARKQNPEGGCVGWEITLELEVDGIPNPGPVS